MQTNRLHLVRSISQAQLQFIYGFQSGALTNVVNSLVRESNAALGSAFALIARSFQMFLYTLTALLISVPWTIGAIIFGLITALLLAPTASIVRASSFEKTANLKNFEGLFIEGIQSIKLIQSMALKLWFVKSIQAPLNAYSKNHIRQVLATSLRANLPEVVLVTFFLGFVASRSDFDISKLVEVAVLLLVFSRVLNELNQLLAKLQQLLASEGAVREVEKFSASVLEVQEVKGGKLERVSLTESIEFRQVTLGYQKKPILSGLNVKFAARKFHLICGRSGVGKTTLLDATTGLIRPIKGAIKIDGQNIADVDQDDWRSKIGYLPQEPYFFNLTLRQNLSLDQSLSDEMIWMALEQAGAYEFVNRLSNKLNTNVGERGMFFSGGQRQRLSLARAILREPKLLILDEATSGLDLATEKLIGETLRNLSKNMTIMLITHQRTLEAFADEIHILNVKGLSSVEVTDL